MAYMKDSRNRRLDGFPVAAEGTVGTARTADFTATMGAVELVTATAGQIIATLPAAPAAGRQVTVTKTDDTAALVVVTATGTERIMISGSPAVSEPLRYAGETRTYLYDGSGLWHVIGGHQPFNALRFQFGKKHDVRHFRPSTMTTAQVADGVQIAAACTSVSGSNRVTVTGAAFTSADNGKVFGMVHGGSTTAATGQVLYGYMTVVDATHVDLFSDVARTVPANAGQSFSNQNCAYGTPQDALFQGAIAAATTRGGTVYMGTGTYVFTQNLPIQQLVAMYGDSQQATILIPIFNGSNFINNPNKTTPDIHFEKFTIMASYMGNAGGYNVAIKPLNISAQQRVTCVDVNIFDSPATAFPFDYSVDQTILNRCVAYNAGRTANSAVAAGGSGFGIGVKGGTGDNPTMVTNCSAINCPGNYGLFIESQTGTQFNQGSGHQVIGNYMGGCRVGIGLSGAANTIVQGNIVSGNQYAGIAVDGGTYDPGMMSTLPLITGNTIYGTIGNSAQVLGSVGGSGILIEGVKLTSGWQSRVKGNSIHHNLRAGIEVVVDSVDAVDLSITDNDIHANGGPGIWVRAADILTATDAVITSGSANITTVTSVFSAGLHRGRPISGPGIPAGAHIVTVTSSKAITISSNATAPSSGSTIVVGLGTAALRRARFTDNAIFENGTAGVTNQQDGIRVDVPVVNCWFEENKCWDDQTTKTQQYGINLASATAMVGGTIKDNDVRGNAQTVGLAIATLPTGGTTIIEQNPGYNPQGIPATDITVGASPFTYQAGPTPEMVYFNGGTVSSVSKNSKAVFQSTPRAGILLGPNESIIVTYTAAPSMIRDRR